MSYASWTGCLATEKAIWPPIWRVSTARVAEKQIEYITMHMLQSGYFMSLDEFGKEKLWPVLVEAVHALVLYPSHKAYIRDMILPEKPEITASELAARLNMSVGEAIVILAELVSEKSARV